MPAPPKISSRTTSRLKRNQRIQKAAARRVQKRPPSALGGRVGGVKAKEGAGFSQ